jgi:hypothetical protein
MDKRPKLSRCPYCGRNASILRRNDYYGIGCSGGNKCVNKPRTTLFKSLEQAAISWNRIANRDRA